MNAKKDTITQLSKFQILCLVVILIGLLISISLVQRQQQLRGMAQDVIGNAFEVYGEGVGRVNENTWTIKSLDVTIRVTNPSLLLNP